MNIQLFADAADIPSLEAYSRDTRISGFTTNPTLMKKAGIIDYIPFAQEALRLVSPRPLSLEVFADDLDGMEYQARLLSGLGYNVFVKIPITTTSGEPTAPLVKKLAAVGLRLNVTAILTLDQVAEASRALGNTPSFVSVFAGRIADTGRDPMPLMAQAVKILSPYPKQALIWASPRELLNVIQAAQVGCHVITATPDILKKLPLVGKDLAEYSLETVKMFHRDGQGYTL